MCSTMIDKASRPSPTHHHHHDESGNLTMEESNNSPWPRRSLRALLISHGLIVAAAGMYMLGVFLLFSNFSFGSGGDSRTLWVWIAGAILGFAGICGVIYSFAVAVLTWQATGSSKWLVISLAVPLAECVIFTLVWRGM